MLCLTIRLLYCKISSSCFSKNPKTTKEPRFCDSEVMVRHGSRVLDNQPLRKSCCKYGGHRKFLILVTDGFSSVASSIHTSLIKFNFTLQWKRTLYLKYKLRIIEEMGGNIQRRSQAVKFPCTKNRKFFLSTELACKMMNIGTTRLSWIDPHPYYSSQKPDQ